jgi:hypothetical protein
MEARIVARVPSAPMAGLFTRLKQRFCSHPNKRAWDLTRLPDGAFRVRLYCPDCGHREDVLRDADDVIQQAAGDNADMRDTMKRNLDGHDSNGGEGLN